MRGGDDPPGVPQRAGRQDHQPGDRPLHRPDPPRPRPRPPQRRRPPGHQAPEHHAAGQRPAADDGLWHRPHLPGREPDPERQKDHGQRPLHQPRTGDDERCLALISLRIVFMVVMGIKW